MIKKIGYSEFPKSWDEVVQLVRKLREAGIVEYATAWPCAEKESLVCDFVAILTSFGGRFFDEDVNPVFNNEKGVPALQFILDMIYNYQIANPVLLVGLRQITERYRHCFSHGVDIPLIELYNHKISRGVYRVRVIVRPRVEIYFGVWSD